jgi:Calcineurin-like phosphoesterase
MESNWKCFLWCLVLVHHECSNKCRIFRMAAGASAYPLRKGPRKKAKSITSMNTTMSFWAIADVPYTLKDGKTLSSRLQALNNTADFLIHLGDIKRGVTPCDQKALDHVDSIMKLSPVPVLMIVGDNEFNDCDTDPDLALKLWRKSFVGYEMKYWMPQFQVHRMPERPEVFYFVHKRAIYFGLNFVGGFVHDDKEWHNRHVDQLNWIRSLMIAYMESVDSVILFGQANPGPDHSDFINPFVIFLRNDFPSSIPILYLGGDSHKWAYEANYKVPNWLKVRLTGGVKEPINRITVEPKRRSKYYRDSFRIERFLVN